ncbi:uncharacterized protein LOC128191669 [Crassostrea angulata]|uniref:uncharacterized protein LOC128191669 n=1 Tax=Magallana angulata TaxID=2784310 RepID=UPI0022B1068C|nr:uncharacterized protein LOC128191669 [Crassostrea angulata]XP_052719814.1 uncharacterized protein LOC128191669 [Crassostrea angulata]XP_052719815.1 uncharacterized protein LOC128191669 [Crassostrea angulata]
MQYKLKEKNQEIEYLSTRLRLSEYTNQHLMEFIPNMADQSDIYCPTRLGEMYSQLFDDEWSEALEVFKPKTEDEDDDIFSDTLYILQDLLMNIFEFCKDQSKSQKLYFEDILAVAIGLKEQHVLKKQDTATQMDNTFDENNSGHQAIRNSGQRDHSQQTYKDIVGEEFFNQTPSEKSQEVSEEGKTNTDKSDSSQKDPAQEPEKEDKHSEGKDYRESVIYPTIDRHARVFQKAAASTSTKTKSKLFTTSKLPFLIPDETARADVRLLTYVRKCVELCWYMCMQDPPMTIISPIQGQLVDKALFSFHGRRGKIVEVCVWPALLLHENGPLVCKGYVLPEERNRHR